MNLKKPTVGLGTKLGINNDTSISTREYFFLNLI